MGQLSVPLIATNATTPILINCRPCVVNLKNTGAGAVTVRLKVGSASITGFYNAEKTLAPGDVAQEAIDAPYQIVEVVTTNNSGSLLVEVTGAGF